MRILFAADYWPPFAPGGAEWSNAAVAAALARRGHPVVVVTPNYGAAPREERDGVTVVRLPFPVRLRPGQSEARWLMNRNPLFHAYFAGGVRHVARASGADVVHAQSRGALVAAWLATRRPRRPVVATLRDLGLLCPIGACTLFEPWTTFDCSMAQYTGKCVPFFLRHYMAGAGPARRARLWLTLRLAWADHRLLQAALRRVDVVIGVSAGFLAVLPDRLVGGGRARVVHSLPPPVRVVPDEDAARLARKRAGIGEGPLVLYAGKLSLGKGTPVLLQALDGIRAAVPGVRFAFAGKGDLPLPARDDVHALGSVPQPTLFALYRSADVVVVPSVWPEPLSRVLLEAMRLGRPVVATRVGGSAEAVEEGVTGLLVPRGDAPALAQAVVELLRDPARRRRMGEAAARRAAEVFDEDRLVAALLAAYESARSRAA